MDVLTILAVPDPSALGNAFGKIVGFAIIVLIIFLLIRSSKNRNKGSK
jgi:large-conductance mechanosensitive channel